MDNVKDDGYHVQKMLHYIDTIERYTAHLRAAGKEIQMDDQDSDGIIYKIIQLREEAGNLSEEFLEANPNIKSIVSFLRGFRNRLVHDYENVRYQFFDEILSEDLPSLKQELINAKNRNS